MSDLEKDYNFFKKEDNKAKFWEKYSKKSGLKIDLNNNKVIILESNSNSDLLIIKNKNNDYYNIIPSFDLEKINYEKQFILSSIFKFVGENKNGKFTLDKAPKIIQEENYFSILEKGNISFEYSNTSDFILDVKKLGLNFEYNIGSQINVFEKVNNISFNIENKSNTIFSITSINSPSFLIDNFEEKEILPNTKEEINIKLKNTFVGQKNKIIINNSANLPLFYNINIINLPELDLCILNANRNKNTFYILYESDITEFNNDIRCELKIKGNSDFVNSLNLFSENDCFRLKDFYPSEINEDKPLLIVLESNIQKYKNDNITIP